jgi:glucosamine--fructose-6-phosphate aminotransferase (isomerizing)
MCGIIGAVAQRDVSSILVEGLVQMEYRGYDSAGAVVYHPEKHLSRLRVTGRVEVLAQALAKQPLLGSVGIAHTRWATHGRPSEQNAHPLISNNQIAVVHNGIIENHQALRIELQGLGYCFESETDTECIAHLLHYLYYTGQRSMLEALGHLVQRLQGSYALAIFCLKTPEHIYGVRSGSPLIVGVGIGEHFIASDPLALLPVTHQLMYLEEGDIAVLGRTSVDIYDQQGAPVVRERVRSQAILKSVDLGSCRHFMQKEIYEQATIITDLLEGNIIDDRIVDEAFGQNARAWFDKAQAVHLVACGSSHHAAGVAKQWIESWAQIPCFVSIASEYRIFEPIVLPNTVFMTISQSGETLDTLAALRFAKQKGYLAYVTICNVPHSTLARESDAILYTRAGVEIGVASTKGFLTQLLGLLMFSICLSRRHVKTLLDESELVQALKTLPRLIQQALDIETEIQLLAQLFVEKQHALFLGRGAMYPMAQEGALKLKEISYIHAEAYPAGELKHGPLALVDEKMPVIVLAPQGPLFEKMLASIQEVSARGGEMFIFSDDRKGFELQYHHCTLPKVHPALQPLIFTIPMQLLAYHIGVLRGTDVDKPRNLAKSVTVE